MRDRTYLESYSKFYLPKNYTQKFPKCCSKQKVFVDKFLIQKVVSYPYCLNCGKIFKFKTKKAR